MKQILMYCSRRLFILPLYWLSIVIPKNKRIWIFGEYSGTTYSDNPKYLFEYINKNHFAIKAVWLSKNFNVIREVRRKQYHAYHVYSILGIYYAIRAKLVVCCIDLEDIWAGIISPKTTEINLWHGTPIKKIGDDVTSGYFSFRKPSSLLRQRVSIVFEWIGLKQKPVEKIFFAASDESAQKYLTAFGLRKNQIQITGQPRNDALFAPIKTVMLENKCKKVIFMPTFRKAKGSTVDLFEPYGFEPSKIQVILEKNNIELWIRLHRYNSPPQHIIKAINESKNIFFYEHSDIYEELCQYDLLITDLSSIMFDYLLLDRPIVFSAFDMNSYFKQDRELYYSYNEITPGPKGTDWNEVMRHTLTLLNTPSLYAEERELINRKFNKYCDAANSARVYAYLSETYNL